MGPAAFPERESVAMAGGSLGTCSTGRAAVGFLAAALVATSLPVEAAPGSGSGAPARIGGPDARGPLDGSPLVAYYDNLLKDQNLESFRQQAEARYTEETLGRLLASGDPRTRRAAVLALGLVGTFGSNASVARSLRDADPGVRALAVDALWSIWFRADTPENNATLEQVQALIRRSKPEEAVVLATALIARAPDFAEAYNQRAIAHFLQGHFAESVEDCQRVLERNPYHIGALSGLGQCQLRLDRRKDALQTFRRALRLQPFSSGLREYVEALEAGLE
jgi:tetratricopeptide (TPR) repeat protein